jgi:hypothetical protein
MSKAMETKINELFEATKDLMSLEEIEPFCIQFREWVDEQSLSVGTLGKDFSKYGLYSKFRSLPLEQGKNAELIPKLDENGNIKGNELKHYVPFLCGLTKEQWQERNQATRVLDRLENSTELDPDSYLEVTGKLLVSNDPHELAVGLIAATGRRPHEILARAKFTPIDGEAYQVRFKGQGKKRGKEPVFAIATLYPAVDVIKALAKLRKEPSTKALIAEVFREHPQDLVTQNRAIDSRRNGSLNRVVRTYFGDKGVESPVLNFRHGDDQDNCKALRAAYAVLATERDCQGSFGAKILHASRLLGHFTEEIKDDRDLTRIATTAGYSDYYTAKPVKFIELSMSSKAEKTQAIRVNESDVELIKKLQLSWKLPNQQSVIGRLIERHNKVVELGKQLQEYKEKITQLEREKAEMMKSENQSQCEVQLTTSQETTLDTPSLESRIEQMIEERLGKVLSGIVAKAEPIEVKSKTQLPSRSKEQKPATTDFEGMSNAELWRTKVRGAADEKIRRSYSAVAVYNDTIATGDGDKLAITGQVLRELSGVNGQLVGDWLRCHADEVIGHNQKHGMENTSDPRRLDTYFNKRHGKEKVVEILREIRKQCLDGLGI